MSEPGTSTRPPPIRGPAGVMLSHLYGAIIGRRNRRFDAGVGVVRLDRPVISVGNLSVGGTGKTPMVAHLCRVLRAAGHDPCIAMRGYGAASGESDEARVYEREVPGVPVVAQPHRVDGLVDLFATERGQRVDCIVLDDGFQHRQIARDADIVLLDAMRDPWADRLLPAGWLREGVASLARAHAVVVTHAEAAGVGIVPGMLERAGEIAPGAVLASCRHAWECLLGIDGAEHPVATLRGRRVAVCCAIGNPGAFVRQVKEAGGGGVLAAERVLRDHDPYAPATIASLLTQLAKSRAECLVVTEKDWAKLASVKPAAWPCPVYRPRLRLVFDQGGPELERMVLGTAGAAGHEPREE